MGCHSIAAGWYALTPVDKPVDFLAAGLGNGRLRPAQMGPAALARETAASERGVDYAKTPAEDFATGMVTYRNPETGQKVKAQFTNSWMFEKQGLRLLMDGMGPGYAFEVNTLPPR